MRQVQNLRVQPLMNGQQLTVSVPQGLLLQDRRLLQLWHHAGLLNQLTLFDLRCRDTQRAQETMENLNHACGQSIATVHHLAFQGHNDELSFRQVLAMYKEVWHSCPV